MAIRYNFNWPVVDTTGLVQVEDLVAVAVPAGARFINGAAFNATTGARYVTSSAVASQTRIGGVAHRSDGATFVTTSAPAVIYERSGVSVDTSGVVFYAPAGTAATYKHGLPFSSTRALVTA